MAKLWDGDERGMLKASVASCLPPRFPTFTHKAMPSFDNGNSVYNYRNIASINRSHQRQHQRSPSCNEAVQEQPPWLEELLQDSEAPNSGKRSHRRCASDSFTYLESTGNLYTFSYIAEEDESECVDLAPPPVQRVVSLDGVGGHQLTNLWEEIQQLQKQQKAPISSRISQTLDYNSSSPSLPGKARASPEGLHDRHVSRAEIVQVDDGTFLNPNNSLEIVDAIDDPKGAKRVLSNRQSAQRSRVRKLQYIAELERTVNALQGEVSSLSPQVLYFDHQRILLSMDNNALKQQITSCMREKKLKDFQNDMLKKDLQRLRKLYEIQLLRRGQVHRQVLQEQPPSQRLQRHSSLPTDVGIQAYDPKEAGLCALQGEISPSPSGLDEQFSKISLALVYGTKNPDGQPTESGHSQSCTSAERVSDLFEEGLGI